MGSEHGEEHQIHAYVRSAAENAVMRVVGRRGRTRPFRGNDGHSARQAAGGTPAGSSPAGPNPAPLRTYPPRQPAEAASQSQARLHDPFGQDMVQARGRARPGRDISWPQHGNTCFPHFLGEPDRIPAGARLKRERADGLGAAGRQTADADGVVIPAGREFPARHPRLIAERMPQRQILAGGPDPDPDHDARRYPG